MVASPWLNKVLVFLLAVLVAAVVGSISSTQFVLMGLTGLDVDISIGDRLGMTLHDVTGMGRLLFLVYGFALLVAFLLSALAARWLPGGRQLWFATGGAAATTAVLLLMEGLVGGMPVAGARSTAGLLGQSLAGLLAGLTFVSMTSRGGGARDSG